MLSTVCLPRHEVPVFEYLTHDNCSTALSGDFQSHNCQQQLQSLYHVAKIALELAIINAQWSLNTQ